MSVEALLSLGGNVGDRKATIDAAVARLAALPGTKVSARSSYYRTRPVGPVRQAWFVNIAVALRTSLGRAELEAACRAIEAALGRDRANEIPSGPRTLDIDVIAYDSASGVDGPAFVTVPLAEITAGIGTLAARASAEGVRRLDWRLPTP